jgi:hypothetical protein
MVRNGYWPPEPDWDKYPKRVWGDWYWLDIKTSDFEDKGLLGWVRLDAPLKEAALGPWISGLMERQTTSVLGVVERQLIDWRSRGERLGTAQVRPFGPPPVVKRVVRALRLRWAAVGESGLARPVRARAGSR